MENNLSSMILRKAYHNFNFDYVAKKLKSKSKNSCCLVPGKMDYALIALKVLFDIEPYSFCDNSPKAAGTEIRGVRVISFDQLKIKLDEEFMF